MLDAIEAAIAGQRWEEALTATVGAWRDSRATELGDLVDVLTVRALVDPVPHRLDGFEEAWHERAQRTDDASTGALVASLGRTTYPQPNYTWPAIGKRLEKLTLRAPDPRIAQALTRLLVAPPSWAGRSHLDLYGSKRAQDLIVANADRRTVERIERDVPDEEYWTRQGRRAIAQSVVPRVRAALASYPVLDEETRARVLRCIARARPGKTDDALTASLLAAVHADPADDDARSVLADVLLERDEPRGEYIALALQIARGGRLTVTNRGRVGRLLAAHEPEWLGESFMQVLDRRVWHRGMLDRAILVARSRAPAAWEETENDPRAATLRVLDQGVTLATDLVAFASRPGLRGLRALTLQTRMEPSRVFFESVAGVALPNLTTLRLSTFSALHELDALVDVMGSSFPSLTRLELLALPAQGDAKLARALLDGESFARLTSVHLDAREHYTSRLDPRAFLPLLASSSHLREMSLTTPEVTITVTREEKGLSIELRSKGHGFDLLGDIRNVARLEVVGPGRLVDRKGFARMVKALAPGELVLPKGWSADGT